MLPCLLGLAFFVTSRIVISSRTIVQFDGRIGLEILILVIGSLLSFTLVLIRLLSGFYQNKIRQASIDAQTAAAYDRKRFLGRLDHELKNPLTALQAELRFFANNLEIEDRPKTVSDIFIQVERLCKIVTGLRKLADLEEQSIEYGTVYIGDLLSEVLDAAQAHPDFDKRQVHLTLLQSPWQLSNVQGDRALLSFALYNLLENAIKYTQEGDQIEIRAFEVDDRLIIEVADKGPGISEDDLPFIFDELFRGKNARGLPGSGLGLTLTHTIIKKHKGTITVKSQSGQGSVFSIRLSAKS
jgi:two-component system OmpR family sensor kinase